MQVNALNKVQNDPALTVSMFNAQHKGCDGASTPAMLRAFVGSSKAGLELKDAIKRPVGSAELWSLLVEAPLATYMVCLERPGTYKPSCVLCLTLRCAAEDLWHWALVCPALGAFADRSGVVFKLPSTAGDFAAMLAAAGYSGQVQWALCLRVRQDLRASLGSLVVWHGKRRAWVMNTGNG